MSRISVFVCALVLSLFVGLNNVAAQETLSERQVIVQASVGQPGRELTYLNFTNLEERPVMVFVMLTKESGADQNGFGFTLPASARKSIGFHELDLAAVRAWLGTAANFSATIHYEYAEESAPAPPTIAAEMVWYSATPFRQVDSTVAVVRRSVKW